MRRRGVRGAGAWAGGCRVRHDPDLPGWREGFPGPQRASGDRRVAACAGHDRRLRPARRDRPVAGVRLRHRACPGRWRTRPRCGGRRGRRRLHDPGRTPGRVMDRHPLAVGRPARARRVRSGAAVVAAAADRGRAGRAVSEPGHRPDELPARADPRPGLAAQDGLWPPVRLPDADGAAGGRAGRAGRAVRPARVERAAPRARRRAAGAAARHLTQPHHPRRAGGGRGRPAAVRPAPRRPPPPVGQVG
jgi:hypothetical protein